MNCDFSIPVNLGTGEKPDFEYSKMICDNPDVFELIGNETTGAEFYLDKSFSYGDWFLMFFVFVIFLVGITKLIWDFFN